MLHRPDRETVVPIVVVLRVYPSTVEVQVPSVAGTVPRRRPVVPVRTAIVAGSPIAVAGAGEEESPKEYLSLGSVLLCGRLSPIRLHGRTNE